MVRNAAAVPDGARLLAAGRDAEGPAPAGPPPRGVADEVRGTIQIGLGRLKVTGRTFRHSICIVGTPNIRMRDII